MRITTGITLVFLMELAGGIVIGQTPDGPASSNPPATAPSVDLKDNALVQKALADQEKANSDAEADFNKKLDALKAEKQKKVDAAKTACIQALRRAESVAVTLKKPEEALTIKALADTIQADKQATATTAPAMVAATVPADSIIVGTWKGRGQVDCVVSADGTVVSYFGKGTWTVVEANKKFVLKFPTCTQTWTMRDNNTAVSADPAHGAETYNRIPEGASDKIVPKPGQSLRDAIREKNATKSQP